MNDRMIYNTIVSMNENINTDHDVETLINYLRDNVHHVENDRLARVMLTTLYTNHIERFEPSALTDELMAMCDSSNVDFDSLPDTYYLGE